MDFLERWFGVSPDGGSGAFEGLLVLAAAVAVVSMYLLKSFATSQARRRGAST